MRFFDVLKEMLDLGEYLAGNKSYKDILISILIPTASLSMVIAVTLFLGGLFHKIQPFFSIIQGILTFLFGMYCFWYAHRISKISSISYKKAWSNYDFRFSIKAGVISLITSIFAFFVATLKNPGFNWFSVMLFIIGFGLYCLGLYYFLKTRLEELGESDEEVHTENSQSTDADSLDQIVKIVGSSVVGLLYVVTFLPLTLWSAATHGLDFVDVLLFAHLTRALAGLDIIEQLTIMLNFSNPSDLFAFCVIYGVVGIIYALMSVCLRKEGWLEILIMSNGLTGGYSLTIWIKHLLGTPLNPSILFPSGLSFSYVFVLYYGLRSLLDLISRWGIRAKYEFLISGIQGIGTGWILSRIFGDQFIIFNGIVFFVCTFVVSSVFEATIGRLFKLVPTALPERVESIIPVVLTMARERHPEFWSSVRVTVVIFGIFPFFTFGVLKLVIMVL